MIRKIILNYKFNDKSYLYKTFVNFLLKNEKFFEILKSYDTIIPVPISTKRRKERGYNQSELIAREIAKKVEIEYNYQCLFKTKNIVEQSKLNKEKKQKNIQGVYQIDKPQLLENKKQIYFILKYLFLNIYLNLFFLHTFNYFRFRITVIINFSIKDICGYKSKWVPFFLLHGIRY